MGNFRVHDSSLGVLFEAHGFAGVYPSKRAPTGILHPGFFTACGTASGERRLLDCFINQFALLACKAAIRERPGKYIVHPNGRTRMTC